jgi:hypothetical protein
MHLIRLILAKTKIPQLVLGVYSKHWLRKFLPFKKSSTSGLRVCSIITIFLLIFSLPLFFVDLLGSQHQINQEKIEPMSPPQSAISQYVEKLLTMPEDQIDIGAVALNIRKEFNPKLNILLYYQKIDWLVREVRLLADNATDPLIRIAAINQLLFYQENYRYDDAAIQSTSKVSPYLSHLNHLLDTKQGDCFSLITLYLTLAQRLGYPIYPVEVPNHLFLRYVDPITKKSYNIEATDKGPSVKDDFYIKKFKVPQEAIELGTYMRTLTYQEFLGYLLKNEVVNFDSDLYQIKRRVYYLQKAVELAPRCAEIHISVSHAYLALSAITQGEQSADFYKKSVEYEKTFWKLKPRL